MMTPDDKLRARKAKMLQKFREYTLTRCKARTAAEFQRVIRLEAIEEDGLVSCVTCDWRGDYRDCDAGHFVPRRYGATLFDPRNAHVQCRNCNKHLAGNMSEYRRFMRDTYGIKTIRELEASKQEVRKFTKEELVELRIGYMDRAKALLERLSE